MRLAPLMTLLGCCFIASSFMTPVIQGANLYSVKVQISGCRNSIGSILVSLFDQPVGFPSNPQKAIKKVSIPILNESATIEWSNLPKGKYAIAVLHDEDENKKMTTTFLGLPKEGYGFSNNVTGLMGPPAFDKAAFKVDGAITVYINMHY